MKFINSIVNGVLVGCGLAFAYWLFVDMFGFHILIVIG